MDGDQPGPKRPDKGFAGLSGMVSDVAEALREGTTKRSDSQPTAAGTPEPSQAHGKAEPASRTAPSAGSPSPRSGDNVAIVGIPMAIVAIFLIAWLSTRVSSTASGNGERQSLPAAGGTPSPRVLADSSPAPDRREEQPPIARGAVLTLSQIRYCLSESIRIDGADPIVDVTSQREVDIFNTLVEDYNDRCSSFRYHEGDLERVRKEIEPLRASLLAAGRDRFLARAGRTAASDPSSAGLIARIRALLRDPRNKTAAAAVLAGRSQSGYSGTVTNSLLPSSPASLRLAFDLAGRQDSEIRGRQLAGYVLIGTPLEGSAPAVAVIGPAADLVIVSAAENGDTILWFSNDLGPTIGGSYRIEGGSAVGQSGVWQATLTKGESLSHSEAWAQNADISGDVASLRSAATQSQGHSTASSNRTSRPLSPTTPPTPERASRLEDLDPSERQMIQNACSTERYVDGPAAYQQCTAKQLRLLAVFGEQPDLAAAPSSERQNDRERLQHGTLHRGPGSLLPVCHSSTPSPQCYRRGSRSFARNARSAPDD